MNVIRSELVTMSVAHDNGPAGSSKTTGIGEDIASAAKDQANTLLSQIEAGARRHPLGVVSGAFGIGMLIGLMKGRH